MDESPGAIAQPPAERPDRLDTVKRALIGRPRSGAEMGETLLSKTLALPIFASDPLSSVAYATEAALVVLVGVSLSSAHLVLPVSIAIAVVLGIVVLSYTQTVKAYETSGGAYVVAKENLGTLPSLVAAAALLVDYVLTVSVSVAAGVLAITSAAPSLAAHKVGLCLLLIVLLTVVNLRGVRESGIAFALPTYSFVAVMYVMIATGLAKCATSGCPQAHVPDPITVGAAGSVGVLVVLRAFASGAAALTGVESISNGVGAFKPPQGRNAAQTLLIMGAMAISLFVGVSYLAVHMHALPSESVSVVSEIARATFPAGSAGAFVYYLVQGLTFAILVLAANTSYQGFPRLSAILARDRYFPRQFVNLGDRLVYSNGIIVLAVDRVAPDLGVQRGRERADPPVRDRGVHRLHPLADRDGAVLGPPEDARLAQVADAQRRRCRGDDRRRAARHRDEVPGGCLGGRGRDPAARPDVLRNQRPLPEGRAPPARGRERSRGRSASDQQCRALRRLVRHRAPRGRLVRPPDRGRRLPRDPCPRTAQRHGHPTPLPPADGDPPRPRDRPARRTAGWTR